MSEPKKHVHEDGSYSLITVLGPDPVEHEKIAVSILVYERDGTPRMSVYGLTTRKGAS